MSKRFYSIILLLAALWGHAVNSPVTVGGVVYTWSQVEQAYTVSGCDELELSDGLHILSVVEGLDVVAIDARAFEDNTSLASVTIDEGITSIGQNAFCRCENLKTIILPDGLERIEEEAFAFCSSLTMVVIPASVREIESHAFYGCTGVTDVYFLMTTRDELDSFNWWDGVYTRPGEDEHGGLEFNQSRKPDRNPADGTRLHVPADTYSTYEESGKFEAWLFQEHDANYPLWWIVNYGTVGKTYTVADDLTAVYIDINGSLYAKDGCRWPTPAEPKPGQFDYMKSTGLMSNRGNVYDQSNWVELTNLGSESLTQLSKHIIKGGTITGTLVNKRNPAIEVADGCTPQSDDAVNYIPNVYIVPSFAGSQQCGIDTHMPRHQHFFVTPKPQEYCEINWAVYDAETQTFSVPMYQPDDENKVNTEDLSGTFHFDTSLNEYDDLLNQLITGQVYTFHAIVRRMEPGQEPAPMRRVAPKVDLQLADNIGYMVFPVDLNDSDEHIVTGIDSTVSIVNTVTGTRYVDLQGRMSASPLPGMNVVITRYSDGTTTTSTMMF